MHAARRDEAKYMECARVATGNGDGLPKHRINCELTGFDGAVDAGEILVDDAPGTDVEMSHLGVAHLAARQPDRTFGGVDRGVREFPPQAVPIWFAGRVHRGIRGGAA